MVREDSEEKVNTALVGIYTITPLHCGTGQAAGAIDQLIARERHTGHPLIPATSIKGRLRDIAVFKAENNSDQNKKDEAASILAKIFGPGIDKGDEHAGALVLTDARLIAFPVRSLQAVFYWITCPMILKRCQRDLAIAKIPSAPPSSDSEPPEDDTKEDQVAIKKIISSLPAKVPEDNRGTARGNKIRISGPGSGSGTDAGAGTSPAPLILEDLAYEGNDLFWNDENAKKWAKWLQCLIPKKEPNRSRILDHLVILPDKDYDDLVTRTTPVTARIALNKDKDKDNKTSDNLWYEETLPPDSLFYTLLCLRECLRDKQMDMAQILSYLKTLPVSPIQFGGNETVGQGWCHWQIVKEEKEEEEEEEERCRHE